MRLAVAAGGEVVLDQLLDLLLGRQAPNPLLRERGVKAEPDGVTVAEEVADGLLSSQLDMLALVVEGQEVEAGVALVEVEAQLRLVERGRQRLARLQLQHLVREVRRRARVGGGQAQAGQPAAGGLAVEHAEQRRLAHAAAAEDAEPSRADQEVTKI